MGGGLRPATRTSAAWLLAGMLALSACSPMDDVPVRLDRIDSDGLSGALRNPEALITVAIQSATQGDVLGVWQLRITRDEYEAVLWPELPEREQGPIEFFWAMMEGRHRKGARALVGELAREPVRISEIRWAGDPAVYPSFTIHRVEEVRVRRVTDGAEIALHNITGVLEWNGLFKILSYRD